MFYYPSRPRPLPYALLHRARGGGAGAEVLDRDDVHPHRAHVVRVRVDVRRDRKLDLRAVGLPQVGVHHLVEDRLHVGVRQVDREADEPRQVDRESSG